MEMVYRTSDMEGLSRVTIFEVFWEHPIVRKLLGADQELTGETISLLA